MEVDPADRAHEFRADRIGHDADNAAEPLAVERMAVLAEQDGRMPADRGGSLEDVGDQIGVDCAGFLEIMLAKRVADGDKFPRRPPTRPLSEGCELSSANARRACPCG